MIFAKRLWGAHLFVPSNKPGFLTRLPLIDIKNIIIDLEYATKVPYKLEGRYLARSAIGYLRQVCPNLNITVRTNLFRTGRLFLDDVRTVATAAPDAIRIPSVDSAHEVTRTDEILTQIEHEYDLQPGGIKLHPMIETPKGLDNAYAIATASTRVEALCLGGEDWAYNCGLERTPGGKELERVRFELVTVASHAQVTPIDSVYNWLDDLHGLEQDSINSFQIGMKARACTNPRQLPTIATIYRPSTTAVHWAQNLLADLTEISIHGQQYLVSHGVISDQLAISQARQILANFS